MDRPAPLPTSSMERIAECMFRPLRTWDCSTVLFLPGVGKRTLTEYLLTHCDRFVKPVVGELFGRTLFAYVHPDRILDHTAAAYIHEMDAALRRRMATMEVPDVPGDDTANPLDSICGRLGRMIAAGFRVCFILQDFEFVLRLPENIFGNFESIMGVDKTAVTYLFLSSSNILHDSVLDRLSNLKYAVSQNVTYFPLYGRDDAGHILSTAAAHAGVTLSDGVREALLIACGGHPQLIKYATYILSADPSAAGDAARAQALLGADPQLRIVCRDIWSVLGSDERDTLMTVARGVKLPDGWQTAFPFLSGTRLVTETGAKQSISGTFMESFVLQQIPAERLVFDETTRQLYYGHKCITGSFTPQECRLLSYIILHTGEVIGRDTLATVLWGDDMAEKYSDWCIDKTISTIRKKLETAGFPSAKFVTLKKRGVTLSP